jgi:hypothetical protein
LLKSYKEIDDMFSKFEKCFLEKALPKSKILRNWKKNEDKKILQETIEEKNQVEGKKYLTTLEIDTIITRFNQLLHTDEEQLQELHDVKTDNETARSYIDKCKLENKEKTDEYDALKTLSNNLLKKLTLYDARHEVLLDSGYEHIISYIELFMPVNKKDNDSFFNKLNELKDKYFILITTYEETLESFDELDNCLETLRDKYPEEYKGFTETQLDQESLLERERRQAERERRQAERQRFAAKKEKQEGNKERKQEGTLEAEERFSTNLSLVDILGNPLNRTSEENCLGPTCFQLVEKARQETGIDVKYTSDNLRDFGLSLREPDAKAQLSRNIQSCLLGTSCLTGDKNLFIDVDIKPDELFIDFCCVVGPDPYVPPNRTIFDKTKQNQLGLCHLAFHNEKANKDREIHFKLDHDGIACLNGGNYFEDIFNLKLFTHESGKQRYKLIDHPQSFTVIPSSKVIEITKIIRKFISKTYTECFIPAENIYHPPMRNLIEEAVAVPDDIAHQVIEEEEEKMGGSKRRKTLKRRKGLKKRKTFKRQKGRKGRKSRKSRNGKKSRKTYK